MSDKMPRTETGRALLENIGIVAWFDEETDYASDIRAIEDEARRESLAAPRWVQMGSPEDHGDVHAHRLVAVVDEPVGDAACRWCNPQEPDWDSPQVRAFMGRSIAALRRYQSGYVKL